MRTLSPKLIHMQKFNTLILMLLIASIAHAQEPSDALRFSWANPVGTARSQAIGNAGISLGGDFSSTFINPAGLAQFKTNEFVFTPGFFMNRNNYSYADSSFKGKRSNLNIGNIGFIFSSNNRWRSSNIKNVTYSLALTQTANLNSNFSYRGRDVGSSYSEKWLEEISFSGISNVLQIFDLAPIGVVQAYESYLIDTATIGGEVRIKTNANASQMPLNQSFSYQTRGGMYEGAFAVAWNNNEKFFYGLTIGVPFVNFSRNTTVVERDLSGNTNNDFESFNFQENLTTTGAGVNLKIGIIYKPVEHIRLGLTFHTPSYLLLTDRTNATITSNIENYARRMNNDPTKPTSYTYSTSDYIDSDYMTEYNMTTPWRAGASVSFVFRENKDITKQKGFITADVEVVNYKSNSFSSDVEENREYLKSVNNAIDELYKMAFNARIGAELKFKTFMVRGGFNYMGSPYQQRPDGAFNGSRMTPSLGVGYRDKGYFIDLTYAHTIARDFHVPYFLSEPDVNYPFANNRFSNGQIVATVGFKF